ncbi:MAG: transcriptional repressor LexA [Eubacteriales bacterium]|nr:transcriptional repressor LexA [Eubacteriales bacterium]
MAKLGEKDYQILEFIRKQQESRGFPPTVREICTHIGLTSTATVHARLKKLEDHGLIVKEGAKNRSIKVVSDGNESFVKVPVYGKITAGVPITAVEDISGSFPVPSDIATNKELFMLKVEGESMINAAILDGDMIIVQKQSTADNGDIVVALINGEDATVKTFYKEENHFRLQPENDSMEPIIVDDVEILGKVVGVFRKF